MWLRIVHAAKTTRRACREFGVFVFWGLLYACTTSTQASPSDDGTSGASRQNDSRGSVITLPARCPAHWTGFKVNKGGRYEVRVIYMRNVYDFFVPVRDLRGWPWVWVKTLARFLEHRRRQPYENWFAVVVTVNGEHPRTLSVVNPDNPYVAHYVAPATGELVCYFNDDPCAYWNNFGTARFCVTRLR